MYACFTCMYVCVRHACLLPFKVRRVCQILMDWSYKGLWATMGVLGIKSGSSGRTSTLNCWVNSPACIYSTHTYTQTHTHTHAIYSHRPGFYRSLVWIFPDTLALCRKHFPQHITRWTSLPSPNSSLLEALWFGSCYGTWCIFSIYLSSRVYTQQTIERKAFAGWLIRVLLRLQLIVY